MLDFLANWQDAFAFTVASWQAGLNMIPQLGWNQAVEAWAAHKVSR
jgi:hypothetical protein